MNEGLSVVLPLYNGAAFVQAAIQSIVEQQKLPPKWEIIVVDDGSADNGVEICQKLSGLYPQISVEQHPENRGVAAARNRGVELARYKYLGFIDQDDRWMQDKWHVQFQVLRESNAHYVLGYQQFELQDPLNPPHWFRQTWAKQPQKAFVLGGLLMQRADFLNAGLLEESLKFGLDDVDWFNRARESGLIEIIIEHVVLHRYVHDRNASARTKQFNQELLRLIRAKIARQA
jgi:glycosyltransferase involved in cell wall biosynthesis